MTTDKLISNGREGATDAWLREMCELEMEEPEPTFPPSPDMHSQVMRLTPEQLKHKSAVEKRLALDWLVRRIEVYEEKARLISQHIVAEVELPTYLRANGGL